MDYSDNRNTEGLAAKGISHMETGTERVSKAGQGAKPPKIRYSHDGMIDMIVAEPWISQNELAARFGYTPSWVSTIMTSDAFKAKLELRKDEIVDPAIRLSLDERFRAVTQKSLEVLMEKLNQPASFVPDNLALRAAELGAKSLGLGANQPPPVAPPSDHLEKLADRLVALQRGLHGVTLRQPDIIDGETA